MSGFFYYGEQSGARILRANVGLTQVTAASTEPVLLDIKTWDLIPAGPTGDAVFREASVNVKPSNGYALTVIPSVDEVDQLASSFNAEGPAAAAAQAPVLERGNHAAVRVTQTTRAGDLEVENISIAHRVIRTTP